MSQRKIYVIIVTYNGMKWIKKCLDCILASKETVYPVVIDNSSEDGTIQFIESNYPLIPLIKNIVNVGFGRANNQGIELAYKNGGTHFFLLNQDAYVTPETISTLADIQDESNVEILSPIHLTGKGTRIDELFYRYITNSKNNKEFLSDLITGNKKSLYEVDFVNAAAWMLSKKCLETIGGFDPIFFIYGEDSNYCQRIRYHKASIAITPFATVCHDRNVHGNTTVYSKRAVLSLLLKRYANINEPFFKLSKDRVVFHLWMLQKSLVNLFTLHLREWWYIVQGYGMYISLIPKVFTSRKKNITLNGNYLDLK